MKALSKILGELVAWRWTPAVGLCVASMFYVLVVVALVPDEIGVPMTNTRFAKVVAPAQTDVPEAPTFPTATIESEAPLPQPSPVRPAGVADYGRRGFSPPLPRPEAPPAPDVTPPVPPPAPPIAATPPNAGLGVSGAVEPAPEQTSQLVVAPPPQHAAPGVMFRAMRSMGHAPPGANPPAPPPGAEPPANEAPRAAPDAK